ncbi:response regulator transcription factor [Hathewaya massiliensis]|uniref:response regulator transcription factor n=1 Tax=Hathewaya massiliensis TaxID=1964382 RepID=UPI00115998CA|nr:response regulator transcription factor [Hathewaya massiliensis]
MADKILVLEDELSIRSFIKIKLKNLGYEVIDVGKGTEAIEVVDSSFKIALLDIMLPDIDGIEVCKILRERFPNLGIIMLTAKGQESDKIIGLKTGADDYMVKPFSPSELSARIEALLRRLHRQEPSSNVIKNPPFILDNDKKIFQKNGVDIPLTPTEFSIMEYLMNNPNKALDRDSILDYVWGKTYVGDTKTVDVNIRRIRQKIETDSSDPQFLKTAWGFGYIWSVKND